MADQKERDRAPVDGEASGRISCSRISGATALLGALALAAAGIASGGTPKPPLPTPCIGQICGTNATSFVSYGSAGAVTSGNNLTVTETTANAILNWANFNIASGYKVTFVQPSATAQVLNNIWDSNPSVIAGQLSANGQVYLYNQNGIVFSKGAQIDVASLTASTLNFAALPGSSDPDALYKNGILSNNINAVGGTLPAAFGGGTPSTCTPAPCSITVSPGATLVAADGGRIMLLGQSVTNAGSITTPDGQTILGAGNAVYLAASTDPSLRGLLIEVNAGGIANSAVTNQGTISAPRGNVTLAGMIVNQSGEISATTSVSANGSIYLVAGDTSATGSTGQTESFYDSGIGGYGTLLPNQGGKLTLAPGSVTEVLPDTTDTATITETNLANGNFIPSEIALSGQSVNLVGNASVHAPGGTVLINAATDPSLQFTNPGAAINDGGRIYLDTGSSIDVSGLTDVPVAATSNIINVTLEGGDLQNDPLLRNGFLHGTTVTVNVTLGSPLFSVAPYAGNIGIGIDQILTSAGSIDLNSDGDVIARAGSSLNVSGGSIAYQGGYGPSTTQLRAANGQVYSISDAPTDIQYVAIANNYSSTDGTWGTTTTASSQTYYPGYLQGANAGSIEVLGPAVYLQGSLLGSTVAGPYQRSASTLPTGGQFQLGCNCTNGSGPDYRAPAVTLLDGSTDVLGANFDYANLGVTLPPDLEAGVTLSPTMLSDSGFNKITIFSNGAVTLPATSSLILAAAGSLAVTSDQSITIDGDISIAGSLVAGTLGSSAGAGSVSLTTTKQSSTDSIAHDITLGPGVVIDVSGSWVNDSPLLNNDAPGTAPLAIDGGTVSLSAAGNVSLGADSRIDVSGGGYVNASKTLTAGNAGAIDLIASFLPVDTAPYAGVLDIESGVSLEGAALGGGKGGTLSLTSGSVTVGAAPSGTPGELWLTPSFFANQGFGSYSITGQNGVVIGSAGVGGGAPITIAPVEENLAFTSAETLLQPTGSNLASFTELAMLPPSQRGAVSLTFATTASSTGAGAEDTGNILLSQNATIVIAPGASAGGSVNLDANSLTGSISILGGVFAPAGTINAQIEGSSFVTNPDQGSGFVPNQEILLGPQSVLAAPAYAQINTLDPLGYRQGAVLPGGTVALQANKGFVVTDVGSVIDVDGAASVIDVVNSKGVTATNVVGSAGAVDIDAREGIVLLGSLQGQAAMFDGMRLPGAEAGTLSIGLDLFDYGATISNLSNLVDPYPLTARTLTLTSAADFVPSNLLQSGTAQIDVATIQAGGFDSVALKSADVIAVQGAVSLSTLASVTLDAPVLLGDANSSLRVTSAYVALGNYYNAADYFDVPISNGGPNPNIANVLTPTCATGVSCSASLTVNAQLIDVRGISGWAGFDSESLISSGDIRLTSALNPVNTPPALETPDGDSSEASLRSGLGVSGALTLQAQQIYPTTNTDFTLTSAAALTVASAPGSYTTPLSAGGFLTINAPTITQGGVLRAPLGDITLNAVDTTNAATGAVIPGSITLAAGSVTSVSTDGAIIPYGSTVNGQQWTYSPDSTITQIVAAPPAKAINLDGANVSISKGATVDLAGGGDLYAYEFIAGEGGSQDVLTPANGVYSYAIVPSLGSAFAPIDGQYAQGFIAAANSTIYLSGVPGLPTGVYALLPARYALLPGAYAIQIEKPNSGIAAGIAVEQPDGAYVVGGVLGVAGTPLQSSLSSTILIAPDSVVRTQSQYTDTYANTFFSAAASSAQTATPSLPADAGLLQISATGSLALNGTIDFSAGSFTSGTTSSGTPITVQGAGGTVSIQAPDILVVDSSTPAGAGDLAGALQLNAQALDSLGAQTLVLGATTANTGAGEQISVGSTQAVELDNASVALSAPEVILAALNTVTLDPGARVTAKGTLTGTPDSIVLQGGGALLRASAGAAGPFVVDTSVAQNTAGTLSVGASADVQAGGSLLLYSTGDTTADPGSIIAAPALGLYSSRVSIGAVPTGSAAPGGLNLTTQLLGQLSGLTELTIGSTSTIDFYGGVNFGSTNSGNPTLASITLDAWSVDGYGAGNTVLQAGTITLQNSNSAPANATAPAGLYVAPPTGTGSLTIDATAAPAGTTGQILLGAGTKTLAGFSGVTLNAAGTIEAQGNGSLTLTGSAGAPVNLNLQSAALTAASGAGGSISTLGTVVATATPGTKLGSVTAPLGGELSIQGSSIAQNGYIDLPAGIVSLTATSGNLSLGKGSITEAPGSANNFTVTDAVAAGGQISLVATAGSVVIASGATVDVAGAQASSGQAAAAGSLSISAPQGQFTYAGSNLQGAASVGQEQGNFTLDVANGLGGSGLTTLASVLSQSGFTGAMALRSRGDSELDIDGTVTASSFSLTADQGQIVVSGTVNTSGGATGNGDGGALSLWAGTGLTLNSGAQLLANAGTASGPIGVNGTAAPAQAGNITLGTAAGELTISGGTGAQPTLISMQGGGGAQTDGTLTLRAPRTPDDLNVQISVSQPTGVQINSRQPLIVEGLKAYAANDLGSTDAGCGDGGSCDVADMNGLLFTDAATFAANAPAIAGGLGLTNNTIQVRPGIEIDSSGDLVLDDSLTAWDLDSWNAALGAPVNVTLRAAGNLIFNASLSDGFTNNGNGPAAWTFGESGGNLDSGSYRLTAGADLNSANPAAVISQAVSNASTTGTDVPNSGNVILTPGNLIRTGDGSIDIAAGGDVLLGYSEVYDANGNLQVTLADPLSSVIYTAGIAAAVPDPTLFVAPTGTGRVRFTAAYPTDGGNLTISAADDVISAPSAQLVSDWLWRQGQTSATTGDLIAPSKNTSWFIVFSNFEQGVGALGGGNVAVTAGGNIVDLSAVVPTNGQLLGAADTIPSSANVVVNGAGNLTVQAGGNIDSGAFEDDWGTASINAGGLLGSAASLGQLIPGVQQQNIATPLSTPIYPVIVVGSGAFDVDARAGVTINSVGNSTILPVTSQNASLTRTGSYYFTFGPDSALNVSSTGGDVILQNDSDLLPINQLNSENSALPATYAVGSFGLYYPPNVNLTAFAGDIDLLGSGLTLFPSSTGNLNVLAQGSITGNAPGATGGFLQIDMAETSPTAWANVAAPNASAGAPLATDIPVTPLYQNETQPVYIVANNGDITQGDVTLPKAADVVAGGNITDLNYAGKNLNPSDVTLIEAGGTISYSTPTAPVTNQLLQNTNGITLAGPGALDVLTGGTLNLGDSAGIVTSGNLTDSRLSSSGASLVVGAGFGSAAAGGIRDPAYQSFVATYLAPSTNGTPSPYADAVVAYMQQLNPVANANLTYAAALNAFEALPNAQQLPLLAEVLSDELSATGLAHTLTGASYARGFDAINTLFPTKNAAGDALSYSGDIDMFFSQIKTEQGGNINLLAPGGSVIVGVPNPPAALDAIKTLQNPTVAAAANLGLLALGPGAIEGFADQSFEVNQSRILTLEGGDIILWASYGNIDAGAGAKSASGAPPPVIETNAAGNVFVNPVNDVTGSGIGQLLTGPNETAGLVNLIAPNGDVNAGDAGIRVAGNLNIAAVEVIGAGNITVVGTSTGVPTSEAGAFAGALSGANSLGDASKNAVEALSQDLSSAANYQQLTDSLAPSFIIVKLFCLGIECETH